VTATTGSVRVEGAAISGTISAVTGAEIEATGAVSGDVTASAGAVFIAADGDVSGDVQGSSSVSIETSGAISGPVSSSDGHVLLMADGAITGAVTADTFAWLDSGAGVNSTISATSGGVRVSAAGGVQGSITAGEYVEVDAAGSVSATINSSGEADVFARGSVSGSVEAATDVWIDTAGDVTGFVSAGGRAYVSAWGNVSGGVLATGDAAVFSGETVSNGVVSINGVADVWAWDDVTAYVDGGTGVEIYAQGSISGNVSTTTGTVAEVTEGVEGSTEGDLEGMLEAEGEELPLPPPPPPPDPPPVTPGNPAQQPSTPPPALPIGAPNYFNLNPVPQPLDQRMSVTLGQSQILGGNGTVQLGLMNQVEPFSVFSMRQTISQITNNTAVLQGMVTHQPLGPITINQAQGYATVPFVGGRPDIAFSSTFNLDVNSTTSIPFMAAGRYNFGDPANQYVYVMLARAPDPVLFPIGNATTVAIPNFMAGVNLNNQQPYMNALAEINQNSQLMLGYNNHRWQISGATRVDIGDLLGRPALGTALLTGGVGPLNGTHGIQSGPFIEVYLLPDFTLPRVTGSLYRDGQFLNYDIQQRPWSLNFGAGYGGTPTQGLLPPMGILPDFTNPPHLYHNGGTTFWLRFIYRY
jgi:cytoskeletal protein CcmA (bactofilin family)